MYGVCMYVPKNRNTFTKGQDGETGRRVPREETQRPNTKHTQKNKGTHKHKNKNCLGLR